MTEGLKQTQWPAELILAKLEEQGAAIRVLTSASQQLRQVLLGIPDSEDKGLLGRMSSGNERFLKIEAHQQEQDEAYTKLKQRCDDALERGDCPPQGGISRKRTGIIGVLSGALGIIVYVLAQLLLKRAGVAMP